MKHLYYIRHGESVMNTQLLCSGHTDTPLTEHGIQQAIDAGKSASELHIHIDIILASPLSRARNTALAIAAEINYPYNQIEFIEDLRERNFGILEGKNMTDTLNITGDYYIANPHCIDYVDGVETITQLHDRAKNFYDYICTRTEGNILVVGHGAFLRSLQRVIANLPVDEPINLIENAKIIKLI